MIRAKTDMQDRLIEIGEILVPFACHTRYGEAGWRKGGGGKVGRTGSRAFRKL
jgi:hypothetical protein